MSICFGRCSNDSAPCVVPSLDHYRDAVAESVLSNEHQLKEKYEKAVMKDTIGHQEVLFAMADHADLIRSTEQVYASYKDLFGDDGDGVLDRDTVVARLNTLASPSCGNIFTRMKKGWYRFSETMMRGYVRLRAEEQEIELALEYAAATGSSKELKWRARGARRRRGGFKPQDWEKLRNPSS